MAGGKIFSFKGCLGIHNRGDGKANTHHPSWQLRERNAEWPAAQSRTPTKADTSPNVCLKNYPGKRPPTVFWCFLCWK